MTRSCSASTEAARRRCGCRFPGCLSSWTLQQVQSDGAGQVGERETSALPIWDRALARFHTAQAAVDAASGEPDQERYDALLDSATDALCALLALPAPDVAGMATKLDVIVPHLAWELTGAEDCLDILRQDACRLAASAA